MQFKLWHTGVFAKTLSEAQQLVHALAGPRKVFGGSEADRGGDA